MAVMAVEAGVRAEIWVMAVPSCTRSVALPHQASGVKQSDPYASDIHTLLKPEALRGGDLLGGVRRRS